MCIYMYMYVHVLVLLYLLLFLSVYTIVTFPCIYFLNQNRYFLPVSLQLHGASSVAGRAGQERA